MPELAQLPFEFQPLPRGGLLVEGQRLRLQIGCYPETIKDTMTSERGVPDLYLLPDDLFDTYQGVSSSDLEFPVYFNFYLKQQPCTFLCHKHQVRPLLRVLKEAIFGPSRLFLEEEYPDGALTPGYPDLQAEMAYYKEDARFPGGRLRLKHMIGFRVFDEQNEIRLEGATITSLGRNRYRFQAQDAAPQECEFRPAREAPRPIERSGGNDFVPPTFGMTVIGSGHGFDAHSKTSGFIIWVDGKGILVDPPVNSTRWMQKHGINTRLIDDLILTHCHADHDSGTLQKVLEEGRVRIHTTETVMRSFVAKYSALTGVRPVHFRNLFEFDPVTIGAQSTIAGARFQFRYTLHTIPTLSFQARFERKSFYYSCDTLYDPDILRSLHERGVLEQSRMDDLLDVPWDSDLILHEAGIPPVHTPLAVLAALPDEVKSRMYLTHVSAGAIPDDSGLRLASPGPEHTVRLDVPTPQKSLASKILDVISHIDLFAEMGLGKAAECLSITGYEVAEPGQHVIRRDSYGDKFFMILSGEVEVLHESLPHRLFFGRNDYLGETALVLNQPRNADVVARTRTELLTIEREDFLRFMRGTSLPKLFRRLHRNRSVGARWAFEKHKVLAALSSLQKNQMMCSMLPATIPAGTVLYEQGDRVEWYYLVDHGQVSLSCPTGQALLGPGSLVGEFGPCFTSRQHRGTARAQTDLWAYRISADDMRAFFRSNPGTFVRLCKSLRDTVRLSWNEQA